MRRPSMRWHSDVVRHEALRLYPGHLIHHRNGHYGLVEIVSSRTTWDSAYVQCARVPGSPGTSARCPLFIEPCRWKGEASEGSEGKDHCAWRSHRRDKSEGNPTSAGSHPTSTIGMMRNLGISEPQILLRRIHKMHHHGRSGDATVTARETDGSI